MLLEGDFVQSPKDSNSVISPQTGSPITLAKLILTTTLYCISGTAEPFRHLVLGKCFDHEGFRPEVDT